MVHLELSLTLEMHIRVMSVVGGALSNYDSCWRCVQNILIRVAANSLSGPVGALPSNGSLYWCAFYITRLGMGMS